MATIVAAAGGGNWTSGATWVGGVAPTAADDAQLTSTSGNVTVNTGAICRSLDCNTYTGTLTHTAGVTLTIGDATAGAGNIALRLAAGMTYTLGSASTSAITFVSTSATQQSIITAGKNLGNWTINGAGSSYILGDSNTIATTATATLLTGTFDTGNQACSWGSFVFGANLVRTLTLGSSAITISGSATNGFWCSGTTNLTITANTAVVTLTASAGLVNLAGANMNGTSVVFTTANSQLLNGAILKNVTYTGPAVKTAVLLISGNITVTGTFTVNGNSSTDRILIWSNIIGTPRTITAATVSVSNVDFMDITGAGAASWNLSAVTGGSGDCVGNSGITFTSAVAQTWQGNTTGSWSNAANWTSRVPLPQDNVSVNALTSGAITIDMPRLGATVDFTGSTGGSGACSLNPVTSYGNIVFVAGMTYTGATTWQLYGRGAYTITSAGRSFPSSLTVYPVTGSYTLLDDLKVPNSINVPYGTFNANNFNVSTTNTGSFTTNTANPRVINMGSGTWTITGASATPWTVAGANITLNAGTSTIVFSGVSAASRTFAGGGATYNNLTHTVAGSTGAFIITGANTFSTINFSDTTNARTLTLPASVTTTIKTAFNVNGTAGKLMTVNSSTPGTPATLSKSTGVVSCDYLSLQDSTAAGGASWYAGANSTNVSGNSGWMFRVPPDTRANFFELFD